MTTNNYQMWLTFNGESELLRFPVLPQTFKIDMNSKNQSVSIVGLGEITIIQSRPAVAFSFSSFFPNTSFPGVDMDGTTSPRYCVDQIKSYKDSKKPVRFIVTGCGVDLFCTIENFQTHEDGGAVGTIYYSITLKEYRETNVRKVKVDIPAKTATVAANTTRVDNRITPKTYKVKKGDCLWNIAKAYLGSGSRYTEIKKLNGLKSDLIFPNQVLKIPG